MTPNDISQLRLQNQQLASNHFQNVQDLVGWMGAMQAQDFSMTKWAVGARLPETTGQIIEDAFRKGEILRTHILRPTWHLVSPADIHWILRLTAPHIKPALMARFRRLELSEDVIHKSKSLVENALIGGNHLTREEIMLQLKQAKISTDHLQASHLMMFCELEGIVCSGIPKGKNQTYALLEERVQKPLSFNREDALAELAIRYFTSHGPATIQDFIWWSGLPVKDAKNALEIIKTRFISEKIGELVYWNSISTGADNPPYDSAYLLPAYDEFIISYRDRTASLLADDHRKAISDNGLFRPIIVVNGKVCGIWKSLQKKDKVEIEMDIFQPLTPGIQGLIEAASKRYGYFLNQDTEIHFNPKK